MDHGCDAADQSLGRAGEDHIILGGEAAEFIDVYPTRRTATEIEARDISHAVKRLTGLRERIGLFGGSVTAAPRQGGGFSVHATVPYQEI